MPFRHLVAAIDHLEPSTIIDLGCGTGKLTTSLLDLWPGAPGSPESTLQHE